MKDFLRKVLEEHVSPLTDLITDLVFLMRREGKSFKYEYLNKAAKEVLNFPERIEGKLTEEVLPLQRAKFLNKYYEKAFLTKKPITFIETIEIKGEPFIGETTVNPILVGEKCEYIVAIVRDITERVQREEELEKTKQELERDSERLFSLINNNVDAVFEVDVQGRFQSVNQAAIDITGYEEKELIGRPFHFLIKEESAEEVMERFNKVIHGSKEEYLLCISHKSGSPIQLYLKNIPITLNGRVEGIFGIARDITEFKRMEQELNESQEKYRLITENAFDIIKLINKDCIVDYASPSNEKILGYRPSEIIGKEFIAYVHPNDKALIEKSFLQLMSAQESFPLEFRMRHKSGHYLWFEMSATPIKKDGQIVQIVTISRDVTEKKSFREQLAVMAYYDYLSGLPNRRTFDEKLELLIDKAKDSNLKVAVMLVDGNNFKGINDTFGHDAGDAVIKEMANRITGAVRKIDTVARVGGDEIGIILADIVSLTEVLDIAKRVIESFNEPFLYRQVEIKIEAGIGIALYPNHATDREKLLKLADLALYEAKEKGKSVYKVYENNSI